MKKSRTQPAKASLQTSAGMPAGALWPDPAHHWSSAGIPAELEWCEGSGHNAPAGMPAEVCKDAFGGWVRDFFTRTLN